MSLHSRLYTSKRSLNRGEGVVHTAGQEQVTPTKEARPKFRHPIGFFQVYSSSKQEVPHHLRRVVNDKRVPLE